MSLRTPGLIIGRLFNPGPQEEDLPMDEDGIRAGVERRLNDVRATMEGRVLTPAAAEAEIRAHVNNVIAWVNAVMPPPRRFDVTVTHTLGSGGLYFNVTVEPVEEQASHLPSVVNEFEPY